MYTFKYNGSSSVVQQYVNDDIIPTEIQRRGTTFEHYRRLLKAFLFV